MAFIFDAFSERFGKRISRKNIGIRMEGTIIGFHKAYKLFGDYKRPTLP
jgi:hypothetical protein